MIPRLHVPVLEPEDVVRHLGEQEKHWKEGCSAHALAYSWHGQKSFPASIDSLLKSHPAFQSADLIDAFLERQTDLESRGTPSQTDLLAIVGLDSGLAAIAVEGKAGEPAGELVKQWLKKGGKREARLKHLCETLELKD
jgi:hypothetical protein